MPPHLHHRRSPPLAAAAAAALAAVALLAVVTGHFPWRDARSVSAQTDAAASCGTPASGWSDATVSGLRGTLTGVIREGGATARATATTLERLVVTLALANESNGVISLGTGTTVALLTCDGHVLSPNAGAGGADPASLDMAPGAALELRLTFNVPIASEPTLLIVRLEQEGRCLRQLGFPLTIRPEATAASTIAIEAPTPESARFASCDGGFATAGASTSGSSGSDGAAPPETPAAFDRSRLRSWTTSSNRVGAIRKEVMQSAMWHTTT